MRSKTPDNIQHIFFYIIDNSSLSDFFDVERKSEFVMRFYKIKPLLWTRLSIAAPFSIFGTYTSASFLSGVSLSHNQYV